MKFFYSAGLILINIIACKHAYSRAARQNRAFCALLEANNFSLLSKRDAKLWTFRSKRLKLLHLLRHIFLSRVSQLFAPQLVYETLNYKRPIIPWSLFQFFHEVQRSRKSLIFGCNFTLVSCSSWSSCAISGHKF
jgi:hypothetical protein